MRLIKIIVVFFIKYLKNDYSNRGFIKSILFYLFLSFGLGFILSLPFHLPNKLMENINLFELLKKFFTYFFILMIILKQFNEGQLVKSFNITNLLYYPVPLYIIILVDAVIKFLNRYTIFTIGLILGHSWLFLFNGTFENIILLINIAIIFVFIFHLLSELLHSLIYYFSFLPKFSLILSIGTLAFVLYKLRFPIIENNPVSSTINSIYNLKSLDNSLLFQSLLINILWLALLIMITYYLKSKIVFKYSKRSKPYFITKNKLFNVIELFFPEEKAIIIMKDIKYILRSTRGFINMIVEFFYLVLLLYLYSRSGGNLKFYTATFLSTFSTYIWENYLSNQWGFEKSAFGLYLIAPVKPKFLILSKNISFLILKLPFIILNCLLISSLFNFRFIMHLFILYIIINLVLLMFVNKVSLKNCQPMDLNEKLFSRRSKENFSFLAFAGLLTTFIIAIILTVILAILPFFEALIAFLILFILTIIIYFNLLNHLSNFFTYSKEKIYRKLIEL